MKKTLLVLSILAIASMPAFAGHGNGAPSGAHYNLNIIGVQKDKTADMDNSSGHSLFVKLDGRSKILLAEGPFAVLDRNGTDSDGASFQLPDPDDDGDGVTTYSVFARALGIPGGTSTMATCATDPDTNEVVCSNLALVSVRTKGKQSFSNVSKELLYIYVDLDGIGGAERYSLFDDALQDYFWQYDNNGLKVLQLRFYEIPTDIN